MLFELLGLLRSDTCAHSFFFFSFSFFWQLFSRTGSFLVPYGILNGIILVCRSHYWCIRIEILAQPFTHAETKVGRASLTTTRSPTTAALVINVHGIIAAQAGRPSLSSCLLVAGLHDSFKRSLLLATHLLPVDSLLLDLLDLRLKICKGRVAAL
jgi:hypothetical protein